MPDSAASPLGEENPIYGPFFGVMGATAAIVFSGKKMDEFAKNLLTFLAFPNSMRMIFTPFPCLSLCLAFGAAYGTAKSGTGIAAMAVFKPELIMKSIIPVVMSGIIAIYGLVVAVLIAGDLDVPMKYSLYK